MSFAYKDIKDAVVEKNKCAIHDLKDYSIGDCYCYEIGIENATLDLQSSVRLKFNREKLALIIYKANCKIRPNVMHYSDDALNVADDIIANDKDIVEVCND